MKEPNIITTIRYQCPYCKDYLNYNKDMVEKHMLKCSKNYDAPKKDCSTCTHCKILYRTEQVGHDRGYRHTVKVSYRHCELSDLYCDNGEYCGKYEKKSTIEEEEQPKKRTSCRGCKHPCTFADEESPCHNCYDYSGWESCKSESE